MFSCVFPGNLTIKLYIKHEFAGDSMEVNPISTEEERFSAILTSTISSLCKNGMINSKVARVDGLLGITLVNNVVFLVKVQEQLSEIEVYKHPTDVQNCNAKARNGNVGTGKPHADSELYQTTISDVQQHILMAPSEWQVENELNTTREMGVVSGVRATVVPNQNIDRINISACSRRRKGDRNQTESQKQDLDGPKMLEDCEENKLSQDSQANGIVCEQPYLENEANILYDETGLSADAYVKMECFSEDELTNDCHSSLIIDTLQGNHFKSETGFIDSESSDCTMIEPRHVTRTSRQVQRNNQHFLRSPSFFDHRLTARNKRTHPPSKANASRSRNRDPTYKQPSVVSNGRKNCQYKQYNRETLSIAVKEVVNKTLSISQAAKLFGIPRSTVSDLVKKSETGRGETEMKRSDEEIEMT